MLAYRVGEDLGAQSGAHPTNEVVRDGTTDQEENLADLGINRELIAKAEMIDSA